MVILLTSALGECAGMKIFDEFGNEIGEIFEDGVHRASDVTSDSFQDVKFSFRDSVKAGLFMGIFVLIVKWPVSLFFIAILMILKFLFKGLFYLIKMFAYILWWIIRIPYYLIVYHELPDF